MSKRIVESGVWTALVTPFDETGDIDWKSFEALVETQVRASVTGIVLSGTTGESPTLKSKEKVELLKSARRIAGKKLQIMAGGGDNDTRSSIELCRLMADAGADSLLVVTPPYNKPSIAGLKAHFSSISKEVKLPICLYHVPGRTGQRLTADQMLDIAAIDGVAAIKEASGDICLFQQVVVAAPRSLTILSGDDLSYLASLAVGGHGCISVASNLFPTEMLRITSLIQLGNVSLAAELNRVLFPVFELLFCESNPGPVKHALWKRNIIANECLRLPLVPVAFGNSERIQSAMNLCLDHLKRLEQ